MDNSSIGLGHCLLLPVSVEDKLLGVKHIFSPKVELFSGIVWGDLEFLLYCMFCGKPKMTKSYLIEHKGLFMRDPSLCKKF